jgi:predicted Zn-dependent protease
VLAESLRAARTGNAQAALEHADRLARAGRVAESANFYKAAAAKAPKDATLHMKWGTALAAGGRLAEARDALRTAIQADPKRVAAWQTLAAVQIRMRDHVGAADTLSGMLKAVPRLARSGEVQARIDRLRAQRTP